MVLILIKKYRFCLNGFNDRFQIKRTDSNEADLNDEMRYLVTFLGRGRIFFVTCRGVSFRNK